jgi:hypothetical protein
MKMFINGERFTLTPATSNRAWAPVFIDGVAYAVDDKEKLEALTRRGDEELTITVEGTNIKDITLLDRVWLRNDAGTYSRKLDLPQDLITIITINEWEVELKAHPSPRPLCRVIVDGGFYEANGRDLDQLQRFNLLEELRITGVAFEQEITVLNRVWSCKPGSSTYHPKVESAKPFPHAGQTVSLDGVEIEVLHLDRGIVFWYNPEDEIHGMVRAEKLKSSLAETMRADLAKGLGPKELVAIGWSREVC